MRIWLHRETWVSRKCLNIYIFNIDEKKPIKMKRLKLYVKVGKRFRWRLKLYIKLGKRFRWRMTFYRRQSSLFSESGKKGRDCSRCRKICKLVAGS